MTNTEHLLAIAAEVGVNVDELPDTLETTLLKAIIEKSGGDTSALPDNLKSTLYLALADCVGGGGGTGGGGTGGGDDYPFYGDGKTRLYIHLLEGRTSPRLTVSPNGTVTVDWGDGSEPDVLTGTSTTTMVSTPNHAYPKHGDYVITLTIDGTMGFGNSAYSNSVCCLSNSDNSSDDLNKHYAYSIRAAELSDGVVRIGTGSFYNAMNLSKICIPESVAEIGDYAFYYCMSLQDVVLPELVKLERMSTFYYCYGLRTINIPKNARLILNKAFANCVSLRNITIPDGVTDLREEAFYGCLSLTKVVIPASVTSIYSYVFSGCAAVVYYDFTASTAVPTLYNTNAFNKISADCEIRVPAALVDEWKAATNWSTYADKIVGV